MSQYDLQVSGINMFASKIFLRKSFHGFIVRNPKRLSTVLHLRRAPCVNFHTSRCTRKEDSVNLEESADLEDRVYPFYPNKYNKYEALVIHGSGVWKYTYIVVTVSLAAFMIYFFALREENDLDEALNRSLFDAMPQFEETVLVDKIKLFKIRGEDTSDLENRLKQIQDEK